MKRILPSALRVSGWGCACALAIGAHAAEPPTGAETAPAQQTGETPPPTDETPPPADAAPPPLPAAKPRPEFEGAIGPVLTYRPEYQGGAQSTIDVLPGFFLRWGRYTVTNAGGFVTRRDGRDEDVMRGFAADLVREGRNRVNLALRIDRGRQSKESAALTGLPDIRSTVRGRVIGSRDFGDGISASAAVNVDLLGRGGGTVLDIGVGRGFPLWPGATWGVNATLTAADARYMRSYFGVTPQQSAITGYPQYTPGSGWRDLSVGVTARSEFGEYWTGYAGVGASHLLGPAAASPLSQRQSSWSLGAGIARRF